MVNVAKPMEPRFWARVRKGAPDECWLWQGAPGSHGYGSLGAGRRGVRVLAHRYSWELHNGPVPPGLCVCHRCDVRLCVNPDHLFLGSLDDNNKDMAQKGRACRGERHHWNRYTDAQIAEIQRRLAAGEPNRRIAVEVGTTEATVIDIAKGRSRTYVKEAM